MSDLIGRYPLSTADGQSIPLEVVRPHGVVSKTFLSSSPGVDMTIPSTIDIFSILCDQDCIIKFAASGASASALSDGVLATDVAVVIRDVLTVLSPPIDKRSISLRGLSANGTALISYYENWAGLSTQPQLTRR